MKTAISVPDDIFESADELAKRRGISRSELYVTALKDFLHKHGGDEITARLNEGKYGCRRTNKRRLPNAKDAATYLGYQSATDRVPAGPWRLR